MADAFKAAFNGSTGNRLNCACIWFPSLPFFFSPPPLFQRLIDPLSLNASIFFPFHSLSTFSFFTLLYFTRLAFAKFKKISTFLSYQISISSRLFFPRRRIFSLVHYFLSPIYAPIFHAANRAWKRNVVAIDHGREILFRENYFRSKTGHVWAARKRQRRSHVVLNYDARLGRTSRCCTLLEQVVGAVSRPYASAPSRRR